MIIDASLKKVFHRPPNMLLSRALGRPIAIARSLPTELITVENVQPDVLFEDESGELIHAELHGYGMRKFAVRNLIYFGVVLRDYDRAPHQVVFWTGPGKVGVPDGLHIDNRLDYTYTVIDLREFEGDFLLESDEIGEVLFAVLCKLRDTRAAIAHIAGRVRGLPPEERQGALGLLLVLSGMRGLAAIVKEEIAKVPLEINIHENEYLEQIWQEALHVGENRGLEQGLEQGQEIQARKVLCQILDHRFGGAADPAIAARIENASLSDLNLWTQRALAASTLAGVFAVQ